MKPEYFYYLGLIAGASSISVLFVEGNNWIITIALLVFFALIAMYLKNKK